MPVPQSYAAPSMADSGSPLNDEQRRVRMVLSFCIDADRLVRNVEAQADRMPAETGLSLLAAMVFLLQDAATQTEAGPLREAAEQCLKRGEMLLKAADSGVPWMTCLAEGKSLLQTAFHRAHYRESLYQEKGGAEVSIPYDQCALTPPGNWVDFEYAMYGLVDCARQAQQMKDCPNGAGLVVQAKDLMAATKATRDDVAAFEGLKQRYTALAKEISLLDVPMGKAPCSEGDRAPVLAWLEQRLNRSAVRR